jgi:hypothetical protein
MRKLPCCPVNPRIIKTPRVNNGEWGMIVYGKDWSEKSRIVPIFCRLRSNTKFIPHGADFRGSVALNCWCSQAIMTQDSNGH